MTFKSPQTTDGARIALDSLNRVAQPTGWLRAWGPGATVLIADLDGSLVTVRILGVLPETVTVVEINATAEEGAFSISPSAIVGLVSL